MNFAERAKQRRKRITANKTTSFENAEKWDLEFWQKQSPEARLSALVAIRNDILKVNPKIKKKIPSPRHQEDAKILSRVKKMRKKFYCKYETFLLLF